MTDRERSAVSPRAVFAFLVGSLILSFGFGYFVYVRFVRYEPRAEAFLPADAELFASIDVEQGVVYEPFRRHFFELLEAGRMGPESRLKHFERKTTIELGVDTRELALAFGPDHTFTVSIGGLFRQDGVVRGTARMFEEEGLVVDVAPDERFVQVGRAFYFSAPEGVLLLTANEPRGGKGTRPVERTRGLALLLCWREDAGRSCLEVETRDDFPFRLQGSPGASWPSKLGPAPEPGAGPLGLLIDDGAGSAGRLRSEGTLGRDGFDALLGSLAHSLAVQAKSGFDPRPSAR